VTKRKQRRELARWENDTRQWAHQAARSLALSMVSGQPAPATPYGIGVVLDPGERVWAECPVRFLQEILPANGPPTPPVRPWLVTSDRIVGRLGDDHLYGWRWEHIRGCRVDLTASHELVALDVDDFSAIHWTGSGVAPLAVAAVYRLHGEQALIDHPGLAAIRLGDFPETPSPRTPAALPPWRPRQNWFESMV
jgi:hypothetical protein